MQHFGSVSGVDVKEADAELSQKPTYILPISLPLNLLS